MVWVVFLSAGMALEAGRHVSVDLLRARFGARAERWVFALIDVVGLVFSLLSAILAVELAAFVYRTGQTSPTLGVPIFWIYIAPVIGFASLSFRFLLRLLAVRDVRRSGSGEAWEGDDV